MPTASADMLQLSAADLARKIAAGELTSRDAVQAFVDRAVQLDPSLRAIAQPRFNAALDEASQADEAFRRGELLGPLHGVPVTIKDCFAVAGLESTLGIDGFSGGPAAEDSPLVVRLKSAGAIVLGKTNVPQGMLMYECDNPLFGRTLHPSNPERSPGGSSGGEATAVAARMSPLGLGSDLGGSIRQPAHCCGLYGFKPTSGRLTIVGSRRAMPGLRSLVIQPGPIAHCVEDVDLAMRVLLDDTRVKKQPDERHEPWPDYRQINVAGLRVAYWTDNGYSRTAMALARGVHSSAERLEKLGAEVQQVSPPDMDAMLRIYIGLISADGMQSLGRLLKGGRGDSQSRRQVRLGRIPRWTRALLAPVLSVCRQPGLANLLRWSGPRSADDYWRLTVEADAYRRRFWDALAQSFGGTPPDVVLTPPHGLPALRHGTAMHLLLEGSHCYLANLLDAPAGVAPCDPVTAEEERAEIAARTNRWALEERMCRQNADGSTGLPVGVQVMAQPWRDDVAMAAMAALSRESNS